jgi:hypothetical protein
MALGSTQHLTEMSTRNLTRRLRLTPLPPSMNRLSRENVGASTSHNPMGLHGLSKVYALPFNSEPLNFVSAVREQTRTISAVTRPFK